MIKKNYKKTKAQGALEYLMLIGGALLIAVVVILLINSTSRNSTDQAKTNSNKLSTLIDNTIIPPIITDIDCNIDSNVLAITINPPGELGMHRFLIKVDNQIPQPTDGTFYPSNTNNIIYANTNTFGINTLNQSYDISLIALKNNSRSRPSEPPMTCIAHN